MCPGRNKSETFFIKVNWNISSSKYIYIYIYIYIYNILWLNSSRLSEIAVVTTWQLSYIRNSCNNFSTRLEVAVASVPSVNIKNLLMLTLFVYLLTTGSTLVLWNFLLPSDGFVQEAETRSIKLRQQQHKMFLTGGVSIYPILCWRHNEMSHIRGFLICVICILNKKKTVNWAQIKFHVNYKTKWHELHL
jgi:hypothetical protein